MIAPVVKDGKTVALSGSGNSLTGILVHRLLGEAAYGNVILVDNDPLQVMEPGVRHYPVDLSRPGSEEKIAEILETEKVDTFVHLAVSTALSRQPNLQHEIETQGTMHVLSACKVAGVGKIVMESSTVLYGAQPDNSPWLTEDHPLRADTGFQFFADRMEVERLLLEFQEHNPDRLVTVLRVGPTLGPNTSNLFSKYLAPSLVPMLAGFDPPVQIVHEVDVVRAFMMVLDGDHPGVFNIVGDSVLPLATAIRILGHAPLPVLEPLVSTALETLWTFRLAGLPGAFVPYLKYPFLASGEKASSAFGFSALYPPAEVLADFSRALTKRKLETVYEEGA